MKFHDFSPFYRSGEGIRSKVAGDRLIDNPAVADAIGGSGASFNFDGTDDIVTISSDTNTIPGAGDFSWEAWVKTDSIGAIRNIISTYQGASTDGWNLGLLADGTPNLNLSDGGTNVNINGSEALSTGVWHHMVGVLDRTDSTSSKLYIDGVAVASGDVTGQSGDISPVSHIYVGTAWNYSAYFWDGDISTIRMHNRALSAAEVRASYNGQAVPFEYVGASQDIVIPGDFTGNLDGWDDLATFASQTNPANNMVLAASATGQYCRTDIQLVKGTAYRCTYTASSSGFVGAPRFSYWTGSQTAIPTINGSSVIAASDAPVSFEFVLPADATANYFYISSTTSSDAVTLDDVSVVQIGCVAEYLPSGINATQWVDTSGNNLHGTTSTATAVNHTTGALTVENVTTTAMNFTGTPDASSTLDAYETGTWTAVLKDSAGASLTMDTQYDNGQYTRIGNVVYITVYVASTAISPADPALALRLHGLPYLTPNYVGSEVSNYFSFAVDGGALNITAGHSVLGVMGANTQYIRFRVDDAASGGSNMTGTEWSDDGSAVVSGFYFI